VLVPVERSVGVRFASLQWRDLDSLVLTCSADIVAHRIKTWLRELAEANVVVKVRGVNWSDACQRMARRANCARSRQVSWAHLALQKGPYVWA
jgi:hypothetical protein